MDKIIEVVRELIVNNILNRFNLADKVVISDRTLIVCMAVIALLVLMIIIKKLISLGRNILICILMVAFMVIMVPKINTFLLNKIGKYGIIQQKLTEIVDGDIETKVKREYKIATGQELEDEALLEQIKAEQFYVHPNLSDELNIFIYSGYPEGIVNTVLLNISDPGVATIEAASFAEFVSKFFILKISSVLSFLIGFSIAGKLLV